MSYKTAERVHPEGIFSSGFVDNTPESKLADKFSPYLRNARLDGQSVIIRPGHTLHGSLTSGTNPLGIGSYLRSDPTNNVMVVRYNQSATEKLVTINSSGVITEITTGANISSDNIMTFTNIADVIYCMNGSDDFGKLSGTTYSEPSTGIASFAPAFSVTFNGSHWASGWSINSNKVYKSVADNYEDFNSTGSDIFTFTEQITGLAATKEALIYFTKNTIAITASSDIQDAGTAIAYVTRGVQVKGGSVNHTSIVNAGSKTFFVTPTNKICQLIRGSNIDGFEAVELSHRSNQGIDNFMKTLDGDQSGCFGYYLESENLIKWFFKTKGANFNDTCLVYDIIKDCFLIDSNKYFNGGIVFENNNYTISSIEGKVYQDEYGTDDEDAAISFRYETKNFDLGMPTRKKELWEIMTYVAINNLTELIQQIQVDGAIVDSKTIDNDNIPISSGGIGTQAIGTYAIGEDGVDTTQINQLYYVDIIRTKGDLQNKGKKVKLIYTCNSLGARVRLENVDMKIELLPEQSTELTS